MLLGSAQPVLDNYAVLTLVYHHSLSTVKMNIKISGKSLRERDRSYYIPSCHHWKVSWGAAMITWRQVSYSQAGSFLKGTLRPRGKFSMRKVLPWKVSFAKRRMALNLTLQFWHPAHEAWGGLLKRFREMKRGWHYQLLLKTQWATLDM